jgi:hypothetical protein
MGSSVNCVLLKLAELVLRALYELLVGRDDHVAADLREVEDNVGVVLRAEQDAHGLYHRRREALRLDLYLVALARNQVGDAVEAFGVSGRLAHRARLRVGDGDGRAGDRGLVLVEDDALQAARGALCRGRD